METPNPMLKRGSKLDGFEVVEDEQESSSGSCVMVIKTDSHQDISSLPDKSTKSQITKSDNIIARDEKTKGLKSTFGVQNYLKKFD